MSARGITYTETASLVTESCYSCGVLFAMPERLQKEMIRDHRHFYCPSGHSQYYSGESTAERLSRELKAREADLAYWRERYAAESRSKAAVKGQLTRAKNRAAAGICQDCNRTFQNVARHMQTKHGAKNEGMVGKPGDAS